MRSALVTTAANSAKSRFRQVTFLISPSRPGIAGCFGIDEALRGRPHRLLDQARAASFSREYLVFVCMRLSRRGIARQDHAKAKRFGGCATVPIGSTASCTAASNPERIFRYVDIRFGARKARAWRANRAAYCPPCMTSSSCDPVSRMRPSSNM